MFDIYEVKLEITEGDKTQTHHLQAPRMMIEGQFLQLMQQAGQVGTPIKIKLSRIEQIYDVFEQKMIERENFIIFRNNAYRSENGEE